MKVDVNKIEAFWDYFYEVIMDKFEEEFPDEDKRSDFAVQLLDGFEAYREPDVFIP